MNRCFLSGCPRSGTTVAQRLLVEAFDIWSGPETHFFSEWVATNRLLRALGVRSRRSYALARNFPLHEQTGERERMLFRYASSLRACSRVYREHLDLHARENGRAGWLEKTPLHCLYWQEIQRCIPDARMLYLARNPVDTVASLVDVGRRYPKEWRNHTVAKVTDLWLRCSQAIIAGVDAGSIYLYDDIMTQPDAWVAEIANVYSFGPRQDGGGAAFEEIVQPGEHWKAQSVGVVRPAASKAMTVLSVKDRQVVEERTLEAWRRIAALASRHWTK